MKKFVVWVLAIIMLLSVCPMALAAENSEVAPYGGTTSCLLDLFSCTMYSGKGSGYTVATLQKGTTVWSSDTSGTWYKVTYGTDTGYIEEAKTLRENKVLLYCCLKTQFTSRDWDIRSDNWHHRLQHLCAGK